MYWEHRFPRLLTNKELLDLRSTGRSRLLVIADITCDKGGSIEFLKKYSSIQNPFFRFVLWITLQDIRFPCQLNSNLRCSGWCVTNHMFACFCSFSRYVPEDDSTKDDMEGDGILFMAVDCLPTELPREVGH
jgi:hypothetical protein